jgi:hypothetical protein
MEVHAHTHPFDPDSHRGRKKWTHYFWEFLMLFLAVFCGFLAENQREHYVEHQREKKYAALLLADLRKDSSVLSRRINGVERGNGLQERHEELERLLTQQTPASDKDVILAVKGFAGRFMITLTITTFTEMKASGALRYIRNQELIAALKGYYDNWVPVVQYSTEETRTFYNDYLLPYYMAHLRAQDFDTETDTLINPNPVILDRTKKTDQELLNYESHYYSQIRFSLINNKCKPALKQIGLLISMLKKVYHLK